MSGFASPWIHDKVALPARPDSALTRAIADLGAGAAITKPEEAQALTGLIESVAQATG